MAWRGHPLCHWRELHRSVAPNAACIRAVCFVSLGWESPPRKDSDEMKWTPGPQQSHRLLMFPHACRTWCARPGETAFSAGAVSPQEVTGPWGFMQKVTSDPALEEQTGCTRWYVSKALPAKGRVWAGWVAHLSAAQMCAPTTRTRGTHCMVTGVGSRWHQTTWAVLVTALDSSRPCASHLASLCLSSFLFKGE